MTITHRLPSSTSRRRRRLTAVVLVLAMLVIGAFAVQQSLAAASSVLAGSTSSGSSSSGSSFPEIALPAGSPEVTPDGAAAGGEPSEADGLIVEGSEPSVFDEHSVAVTNLDPALLEALRKAAADAADDGVDFRVNSGWRSAALQERMLQDAVAEYGSAEEASRWVATPQTSAHVSGDAVDIGPLSALDWLVQHGSAYGLCQIYGNESWHYELRPDAVNDGCPQMYADPTEDPRMQR